MKPDFDVDASDFITAINGIKLSAHDMLQVEGAGAKVQINRQKSLVPVDTAQTKLSIGEHYAEISATRIVDDIGAETIYAPAIEFGRSDMPNYPMQPFVRPAAHSGLTETISVIGKAFGRMVLSRW